MARPAKRLAFLMKSAAAHDSDECLLWPYCKSHGYGEVKVNGKQQRITKIIHERFIGPVLEGQFVCHKCDNPPCYNYRHLFAASHTENMADMYGKGRSNKAKGERVHRSKLTADDVRAIRRLTATKTHEELAAQFGVDQSAIGHIVRRKNWKHVAEEA